jgi:hypothetical protein
MPQLKRNTAHAEDRTPFGVYDGETPRRGNYPGIIRLAQLKTFKTGTQAFRFLVELDAPEDSNKAKYNGFPAWTKVFIGESDYQLAMEKALYVAITGQPDVTVVFEKSDGDTAKITKIGGVDPVGVRVRVDLEEDDRGPEWGMVGSGIYKATGAAAAAPEAKKRASRKSGTDPDAPAANADPDAEVTVEGEHPASQEEERTAAVEPSTDDVDYHSLSLPKLKAYAKSKGIDPGQPKAALLAALDALGAPVGDSAAPSDDPVEDWDEADFWKWAADQYEEGDVDPTGEGWNFDEAIEMLVGDKYLTKVESGPHKGKHLVAPPF